MSEVIQKQNAEVLKTLEGTCKFTPEQMDEVSWTISKGHSEVSKRAGTFLSAEYERIEAEVKEVKLLLIRKLAERREIRNLLKTVGYNEGFQDGIQASIEVHLEQKGGENSEKQSS